MALPFIPSTLALSRLGGALSPELTLSAIDLRTGSLFAVAAFRPSIHIYAAPWESGSFGFSEM